LHKGKPRLVFKRPSPIPPPLASQSHIRSCDLSEKSTSSTSYRCEGKPKSGAAPLACPQDQIAVVTIEEIPVQIYDKTGTKDNYSSASNIAVLFTLFALP
jgi:hypothetical protein